MEEEDEDMEFFDFLTSGVAVTLFIILGLIGNGISLLVLSRREMRSSINCVLQSLAVYDSLLLLCCLLIFGLPSLSIKAPYLDYYVEQVNPKMSLVVYPIAFIAHIGSTWSTVGVTIERYVAVCHPLKARSFCTCGRARVCNIVVFVFSVCYNLPRFWEAKIVEELDEKNVTMLVSVNTELRRNDVYIKVYYTWLYLFMRFLVPLLFLSVLNGLICRAIRRMNKSRGCLGENVRKEINLALMLVCVVVVFFICNVFAFIVKMIEYDGTYNYYLVDFSNTLIVFNSSINFVIYCIFAKKFRQVLFKLVCRRSVQTALQKINIWTMQTNVRESMTDTSLTSTTDQVSGNGGANNHAVVASTKL